MYLKTTTAMIAILVGVFFFCNTLPASAAKKNGAEGYAAPAEVLFSAKKGVWEKEGNWSDDRLPDSTSFVSLRNAVQVSVSQKVSSVSALHIGSTKAPSVLTIAAGGVLAVGDVRVWRNVENSHGILAIDGGQFDAGLVSVGGCRTVSSTGLLQITSGKLGGRIVVGSALPNTGVGTLSLLGTDIKVGPYLDRAQLTVWPSGNVVFAFGQDAVANLDFGKAPVVFQKGSRLIVRGDDYRGGAKVFPLIVSSTFKDEGVQVEITGFPKTMTAELLKRPNGFYVKITK